VDLAQCQPVRVHAVDQADAGAEQHGRECDGELVDQAGVQVLLDRLAAAGDADVAVAGRRTGLVERALDAVVDEVEARAARSLGLAAVRRPDSTSDNGVPIETIAGLVGYAGTRGDRRRCTGTSSSR
jgi:hypothetical protein